MADIKLLEFLPIGDFTPGNKTLNFSEIQGGASFTRTHLNPVHGRRTQDGSLITQTIRYNKKNMNLTIVFHDVTILTYFEALYESGLRTVFKIWNQNGTTWADQTEFNGTVQILSFDDDMDQSGNVRTITMNLSEV